MYKMSPVKAAPKLDVPGDALVLLAQLKWYLDGPFRDDNPAMDSDVDSAVETLLDLDKLLSDMVGTASLRGNSTVGTVAMRDEERG